MLRGFSMNKKPTTFYFVIPHGLIGVWLAMPLNIFFKIHLLTIKLSSHTEFQTIWSIFFSHEESP